MGYMWKQVPVAIVEHVLVCERGARVFSLVWRSIDNRYMLFFVFERFSAPCVVELLMSYYKMC